MKKFTHIFKVKAGLFNGDVELVIYVSDIDKFKDEMIDSNNFFSDSISRSIHFDSKVKAGISLFAEKCFEICSFNDCACGDTIMRAFERDEKGFVGLEGFGSFEEMGIYAVECDNFHFDTDDFRIEAEQN